MQLQAVRFQNFFSFGNELTEIRLDRSKTTLVIGKNGGGKSTSILDSVVYGLFGKPYRKIKLGQMVNTITRKGLLVEVDLISRGHQYTIRRGQKPAVFEVIRDGTLLDQQSSRDQQDWLEKTVLMIDHRSFVQIVILGSANHVPFMKLPAMQRREVIEDILDIQVFTSMNEVLKEKAGELKDRISDQEKALSVAAKELEVEERHLLSIMTDVEVERNELQKNLVRLEGVINGLTRLRDEGEKTVKQLSQDTTNSEEVRRNLLAVEKIIYSLDDKIRVARKDLSFFEHSTSCSVCLQAIDKKFASSKCQEIGARLEELEDGRTKANGKKVALEVEQSRINGVLAQILSIDRELISIRQQLDRAERDAVDARDELASMDKEVKVDAALVEDLRTRVKELSETRDSSRTEARVMQAAGMLLKDGGIKSRIVAQYVPLMNRLINHYLSKLELFVDIHLDEQFNETIRSRHRDTFSYESFSEGEKLRIDLAILFAWRDIARMRSSSFVDLIVFDEILDGSLDAEGADYFLKLVQDLTDGCHVFIISHRDGLEDKFNRALTFTKKNNFSNKVEIG